MLDYNVNYYPLTTIPYTVNSDDVGTGIIDIWGIYNDSDPGNAFRRGNPLDDSIYIWSIGGGSSASTNTCISVAVDNIYSPEVKTDGETTPAKFAVCAYNYGYDGQSGNNDRGFRVDPAVRLAYDETFTGADYGGWQKSCLLCDINPLDWCIYPQIYVYTFPAGTGAFRTLDNLVSYMNSNPTRRVSIIRSHVFRGDGARTSAADIWDDAGSQISAYPSCDILKHRPLCDNLANTIGKYIKGYGSGGTVHDDYDVTKVYNPFNQALTTMFYRSGGRLETNERQLDIGFGIQFSKSTIASGYTSVPNNNGKCSAFFAHYNENEQIFDDVSYKWRLVLYDTDTQREIPPGFDVSRLSSSPLRFASLLEITDQKDYATYGEAVKAAVLHELAYWGFWIAETQALAESDPLGSTSTGAGIYLPEKIGGVTTGNYFTGADIKNVPYCDNTDCSEFEYKGFNPADGESGDFHSLTNSGEIGCGVSYYALNKTQVNALCTWLNTTYLPTDEDTFIQDFKGENPGDYISTMMFYPFEIPDLGTGSDIEMVIGKLGSGVNGYPLKYEYGNYIEFTPYTFPRYGDFRDTLMKITIDVPFCGTRELDPRLWAGRTLNLRMAIDYPTGVCTCYFYRDGYIMDSISGTIGVPLPLSAVANGSYQVAITNLLASHKAAYRNTVMSSLGAAGGVGTMIAGAASGNIKFALGGALSTITGVSGMDANADKMDNIDYNIEHTAPAVSEVQGGSPFINCGQDFRAKVFICTPKFLPGYNAAVYAKTTGHATAKQGELSKISKGFTRCASADLSGIKATSTERQMIYELMQGGVIV